jgi:hypothetical protein
LAPPRRRRHFHDAAAAAVIKCPARRRRQFARRAAVNFFERCLSRLRLFEKIPTDEQWSTLRDSAQFLQLFNQATEILSGASYSTSALVLLFKSEICRVLSPSDGDSHILEEFKSNMRTRIDYRIPIHDVHVCAVMLDPAQRHLSAVQEFLDNKGVTAVDFLEPMIDKFASDDKLQEGTSVECEESTAGPSWKKAKIDLLSKHSDVACSSRNREIQ